jgi:hypothetical protein
MRKFLSITACAIATSLTLAACNKSSPPPQEPVKPRSMASIEMPLRLPGR